MRFLGKHLTFDYTYLIRHNKARAIISQGSQLAPLLFWKYDYAI